MAFNGTYGAYFLIDDTNELWIRDNTPNSETRYRFRFYFDPNDLDMSNGSWFLISKTIREDWGTAPIKVYLMFTGNKYWILAKDATDANDYSVYTDDY